MIYKKPLHKTPMTLKKQVKKFLTKYISRYGKQLSKYKVLNERNFKSFISFINCTFKKYGIKLRPTKELFSSVMKVDECKSEKNLNNVILSLLRNMNKIYECEDIEEIEAKVELFFNSIKIDPTFISLDQAFINEVNETNYNNLASYYRQKSIQLKELLHMGILYNVSLNVMDDNLIPFYSSDREKVFSFSLYKRGEITFISRNIYTALIHTGKTGEDTKDIKRGRYISISSKLGGNVQVYITQTAEVIEENGGEGLIEASEASEVPTAIAKPVLEVIGEAESAGLSGGEMLFWLLLITLIIIGLYFLVKALQQQE
jgi:hypothetical protein